MPASLRCWFWPSSFSGLAYDRHGSPSRYLPSALLITCFQPILEGRLMSVYQFDPLRDPRWHEFLQRDNRASIFHTAGWLQALQRSYGYEPTVFTTSNEREPLANAMVVCRVNSWLTGRRLVSLPFSDHCEPLVEGAGDLEQIMLALRDEVQRGQLKYVEI